MTNHRDLQVFLEAAADEIDRLKLELGEETIRNYHAVRNEVLDKASRLRMPYSVVVGGCNIGPMIEARRRAMEAVTDPYRQNPMSDLVNKKGQATDG